MKKWEYIDGCYVIPTEEAYFIICKMRDKYSFHVTMNQLWTEDWWIKKLKDPDVKTFTFTLKIIRYDVPKAGIIGGGELEALKEWICNILEENGFLVWKREILRRDRDFETVIFEAFRTEVFNKLWEEKYGKS